MIEAFQGKDIMTSELKIAMADAKGNGECGVDVGGVYRDAISCFCQEFNDSSTLGERQRVPSLSLGYFPCMLSQAFIASVLFSENAVHEETLLKSFRITSSKMKMTLLLRHSKEI